MPKLEQLLRAIIACLGPKTDKPVVEWDETNASFSIQVNARDQGRFIGKGGATIWAIKSIFWYAGLAQIRKTVDIQLREPEEGDRRATPFRANPNWNRKAVSDTVNLILETCFNRPVVVWELREQGEAAASIEIVLPANLQGTYQDPSLAEAIKTLMFSTGMADGCSIKTEVVWK